ncbi:cyclase family protein [Nocardia zapadnayensis]|uniref:cyclase family protein n=1 Tax=Nocardia rhamnosiphila TaxID=426716 RepID=UPI0022475BDA|nr:cyclase family protein [Nocardia zapadnayensis]MCX0275191.1 cyclase family protein [Nocardia zapadnayensis]
MRAVASAQLGHGALHVGAEYSGHVATHLDAVSHVAVALIRTGWAQLWHESRSYVGDDFGVYGLDPGAAEWLAGHGVAAGGADTIAREHRPSGLGPASLPFHRILLHEHGIDLIEVMALETLSETPASAGTAEFLFVGGPLDVVGLPRA